MCCGSNGGRNDDREFDLVIVAEKEDGMRVL